MRHEKIAGYHQRNTQDTRTMEAEHINQIGNTLEDLSARTAELRRYL
jgi:hypothetical protein